VTRLDLDNVLHGSKKLIPRGAQEWLRRLPSRVAVLNWLRKRRWQNASHDEIYDQEYFQFVDQTTEQSAEVIAHSIVQAFHPSSVVDVGCGTGVLLDRLQTHGVEVKGLEYAQAALDFCQRRQLDVIKFDVETDYLPEIGKADVVVSMEVGHQLHEASADRYVDLLCQVADLVIFSSETPGTKDRYPRNAKPHSYWIEKFGQRDYRFDDTLSLQWRKKWQTKDIAPWFYRNLMLFRRL
jgi:SAM-dependent methyltransferase